MSFAISFYHDSRFIDFWDSLIRGYSISNIYEINGPGDVWRSVNSIPDIPRVIFSPVDAKYMPGETKLEDFQHGDFLYVFGSDEFHNPYIDAIDYIYIPIRSGVSLWSVQAAAIVLYDRSVKYG